MPDTTVAKPPAHEIEEQLEGSGSPETGGLIERYFQLIDQVLLRARPTPLDDDFLP